MKLEPSEKFAYKPEDYYRFNIESRGRLKFPLVVIFKKVHYIPLLKAGFNKTCMNRFEISEIQRKYCCIPRKQLFTILNN